METHLKNRQQYLIEICNHFPSKKIHVCFAGVCLTKIMATEWKKKNQQQPTIQKQLNP